MTISGGLSKIVEAMVGVTQNMGVALDAIEVLYASWIGPLLLTIIFIFFSSLFYRSIAGNLSSATVKVPNPGKLLDVKRLVPVVGTNVWWNIFHQATPSRRGSDVSSEASEHKALRREMSSIGRFSLRSQTEQNQCIVTWFAVLSNKKGQKEIGLRELEEIWGGRVMENHERFRCRVSREDDRFFEVVDDAPFEHYAAESPHPTTYRTQFNSRIEYMLTSRLDVGQRLWDANISTGPMGSSGALPSKDAAAKLESEHDRETVALFRVHHALADGVSMTVAIRDACDEAAKLEEVVMTEVRKRKDCRKRMSIAQKIVFFLKMIFFYSFGSIRALSLQFWRMMVSVNPFDMVIAQSNIPAGCRSTTWKKAAPMEEVKKVAKSISKSATVNDLFVSCTAAALQMQLEEHKKKMEEEMAGASLKIPAYINVCIPVHLFGGVLLPGQTLGNKIGAFVTALPLLGKPTAPHSRAGERLARVSTALKEGKTTPAPLIAWRLAKFFSDYTPTWLAKFAMRRGNAKAACVISNIRGFPFKVHWKGRRVEFLSAFLPLPPGIPIGVNVQSYAGDISFTVDADKRAVPDADRFAGWMLEEYSRLKENTGFGCADSS